MESIKAKVSELFNPVKKQIAVIRAEISTLQVLRAEVATAPVPRAVVLARLDDLIAQRSKSFASHCDRLLESDETRSDEFLTCAPPPVGGAVQSTGRATADGLVTTTGFFSGNYVGAMRNELLCWLIPEIVRKRAIAHIDELYKARPEGLPTLERDTRLAQIDEQILELELQEEELISEAEAGGMAIARRVDVDPRVVLGMVERKPDPKSKSLFGGTADAHY